VHQLIGVLNSNRYAIDDASTDWSAAEAQIRDRLAGGSGHSQLTVVSVKTSNSAGLKRKADIATDAPFVGTKKNRRSLTKKH
jgi:N-acetyltransferase 10